MNKLPNSWKFASALDLTVTEYLNKFLDSPDRSKFIKQLKEDFEHGVLPNRQRYELDARL